jgi:hypothetical protein
MFNGSWPYPGMVYPRNFGQVCNFHDMDLNGNDVYVTEDCSDGRNRISSSVNGWATLTNVSLTVGSNPVFIATAIDYASGKIGILNRASNSSLFYWNSTIANWNVANSYTAMYLNGTSNTVQYADLAYDILGNPHAISSPRQTYFSQHVAYTNSSDNFASFLDPPYYLEAQSPNTTTTDLGIINSRSRSSMIINGTVFAWYFNSTDNYTYVNAIKVYAPVTGGGGDTTISISNCSVLNQAGKKYILTTDILNSDTAGYCINVSAENVTLDCQGHTIDGIDNINLYGIFTNSFNTTIKSCRITDWGMGIYGVSSGNLIIRDNIFDSMNTQYAYGIVLDFANYTVITNNTFNNSYGGITNDESWNIIVNSSLFANMIELAIFYDMDPDHSIVDNVTITNSSNDGIVFQYCDNCTIKNSIIERITDKALTLVNSGDCDASDYTEDCTGWNPQNNIYNNLINGSILLVSVSQNFWNITSQPGSRIYSPGTQIGGNYYTNSTSTGKSDICTDSDTNGFCDTSYTLGTANIDYLPLSNKYGSDSAAPVVSLITPADASTNSSLGVYFNCTASDATAVTNITMWSNASGWAANYTNVTAGLWNQSTNNRSYISGKTILWNCYSCDSLSNCGWAQSNQTVNIVDVAVPAAACWYRSGKDLVIPGACEFSLGPGEDSL